MSDDQRVAWLREQIMARLAQAKATAWKPDSPARHDWAAVQNGEFDLTVYPRADMTAHDPVADVWRGDVADFIIDNDPQDVIARCEAELGIIGLYELWAGRAAPAAHPALGAAACVASDALRHVANAYRHKPGYEEHWPG